MTLSEKKPRRVTFTIDPSLWRKLRRVLTHRGHMTFILNEALRRYLEEEKSAKRSST